MNQVKSLVEIRKELNTFVGDNETFGKLVETTFKGLSLEVAKKAMLEALMRGFTLEDFLKKNVYAVPFSGGYSLVTSIDYARKIGMTSGVVGVDAPVYTFDDKGVCETCSVTVKKQSQTGYVGDYTALVYFKEYNTNKNQWTAKPLTMIAKVAEMHALRKACPEELSQAYDETEFQKEHIVVEPFRDEIDEIAVSDWRDQLEQAGDKENLQTIWGNVPVKIKPSLQALMRDLLKKFEDVQIDETAADVDTPPVKKRTTKKATDENN